MRVRVGQRVSTRSTIARVIGLAATTALLLCAGAVPASADSIRNREYWLGEYRISDAWAVTKGEGVTIAVIDTGVDGSHRDLAGAVVGGADFSGQGSADGQQPVGTADTHGTMVASLAAGRGHAGGAGILGAAPAASILSISIGFDAPGDESDAQIADAVRWATDHGADVINMSLTRNTLDWPESWDDAFLYAMEKDVVIIAAAGNRGSGTTVVGAPATMPGVLTVAGVDRNGTASFDASSQGITIGVSAPSEELVGATPGDGYVLWDGTSGAAPLVSGVAALVRAAHPELSATDVINRIVATARPAGAPGVDPIYGYGLLDAAAAVSDSVPHVAENPMGSLAEWIVLYRRADATPVPAPSSAAVPSPLPSGDAAGDGVTGSLLPSIAQLRDVGIPLLVIAVFVVTFLFLVRSALRHARGVRRRE